MTYLLPSVMHAFNIVSQEESHKSLFVSIERHVYAFIAKRPFKSKAKNLSLKCSHCGKFGHLVERYYQLIGFPNKGSSSKLNNSKPKTSGDRYSC